MGGLGGFNERLLTILDLCKNEIEYHIGLVEDSMCKEEYGLTLKDLYHWLREYVSLLLCKDRKPSILLIKTYQRRASLSRSYLLQIYHREARSFVMTP